MVGPVAQPIPEILPQVRDDDVKRPRRGGRDLLVGEYVDGDACWVRFPR